MNQDNNDSIFNLDENSQLSRGDLVDIEVVSENENLIPIGNNTDIPTAPPEAPVADNIPVEHTISEEIKEEQSSEPEVVEPVVAKPNPYNVDNVVFSEEEKLLRAYIGSNANKILCNKFNFAAFFFSGFYMCYRRMFVHGIVVFIIGSFLFNYFPIGLLIINLLCGLFTNKIYVNYSRKRIDMLKKRNMDADVPTLLYLCEADGGAKGYLVVIGIILQGLIAILLTKYVFSLPLFDSLDDWKVNYGFSLSKEVNY